MDFFSEIPITITINGITEEEMWDAINSPPFVEPDTFIGIVAGVNESDTVRIRVFKGRESNQMVLYVYPPMTSNMGDIYEARDNLKSFCEVMKVQGKEVVVGTTIPDFVAGDEEFEECVKALFFEA